MEVKTIKKAALPQTLAGRPSKWQTLKDALYAAQMDEAVMVAGLSDQQCAAAFQAAYYGKATGISVRQRREPIGEGNFNLYLWKEARNGN
jgi:hypothetical protein